jgi:Uma2 family endonuclease
MNVTTAKWSVEDYHRMIEAGLLDDRLVELLNGEIIEMPSEGAAHAGLSTKAAEYLRDLLGSRALIREGHPITISSNNSEPEPDIAIVKRAADYYTHKHPDPNDVFWLIEYADSSLKKDLDQKAKAYAAVGIAEYWVVNLQVMEMVVMREPVEGEYRSQVIWTEDMISPLAFADLWVSVRHMLN